MDPLCRRGGHRLSPCLPVGAGLPAVVDSHELSPLRFRYASQGGKHEDTAMLIGRNHPGGGCRR